MGIIIIYYDNWPGQQYWSMAGAAKSYLQNPVLADNMQQEKRSCRQLFALVGAHQCRTTLISGGTLSLSTFHSSRIPTCVSLPTSSRWSSRTFCVSHTVQPAGKPPLHSLLCHCWHTKCCCCSDVFGTFVQSSQSFSLNCTLHTAITHAISIFG